MSASDGNLSSLLRSHLPKDWHWQRVESGAVGAGTPDLNYAAPPGIEGWLELKSTTTHRVDLRPEQVAWIGRRARAGGRVFVVVRRRHDGGPRRGPPTDELWLVPGDQVSALHREGLLAVCSFLRTEGGPRRWDWGGIRKVLLETV